MCIFVFLRKQKFYSPLNLNRLQFFIGSGRLNPKEPINMYHPWRSEAVMSGEAFLQTLYPRVSLFHFCLRELHKMGFKVVIESALIKSKGSLPSIAQTARKYE